MWKLLIAQLCAIKKPSPPVGFCNSHAAWVSVQSRLACSLQLSEFCSALPVSVGKEAADLRGNCWQGCRGLGETD